MLGPTLTALAAALPGQQDLLDERVRECLRQARPALVEHLEAVPDGGALGLLCLAALHDGMPADDPVLGTALRRLAAAELRQTYDLALRLMVIEACASFPDREAAGRRDYRRLLSHRHSGAFGYAPDSGSWDLSNTQYAALGLRAAASVGVDVPRRVWSELADEVLDAQRSSGGFGYRDQGRDESASMTVAGIAVLAICRQALARPGRTIPTLDRHIGAGWRWLATHAAAIGDPAERWSFYFHYGLERAAILCDVTDVGGVDWYRAGAHMLVEQQQPLGGWQTSFGQLAGGATRRGSSVDTAFAVLFLRRMFQKVAGPVTGPRSVVLAALNENSSGDEVHECAHGLVRRGVSALPDMLRAMRGDVAPRRHAAAKALPLIAGEDFGYDPDRDREANRLALRAVELWYLKHR